MIEALNVTVRLDMSLKFDDLEFALEFSSADSCFDHSVYLDRETGKLYYDSDASDAELPDDVFENEKYIAIPSKTDLGLGKPLVIEFVATYLNDYLGDVYAIFSRKDAYSRFRSLLESQNKLDFWYQYEQDAKIKALKEWCVINQIEFNI